MLERSLTEKENEKARQEGKLEVYLKVQKPENSYSNIHIWESKKAEISKQLENFTPSPTQEYDDKIEKIDTSISAIQEQIISVNDNLQKVKVKRSEAKGLLLNAIDCPNCNFVFVSTDKGKDITKVKEALPILDAMSKKLEYTHKELKKQEGILRLEKESILNERNAILIKNREVKNKNEKLNEQIKALDINIEKQKSYISAQEKAIEENSKNRKETKELIEKLIGEISEIASNIEKQKSLRRQFLDFRISLINKTVKVVEFYCNRMLKKMGSSLSVGIEGYRYKKDGKGVIEKITSHVYREGFPIGNFSRFSTGERCRIEIAAILALQSLINSASSSGGLNLLFLDEIMDSMDAKGVTSIVEDLNSTMSQCIFVITQSSYQGNYDKILKVTKGKDGISKIN
jgi:DNA repair exonuclease SbcCD ATPase subunit